jgi:hypothetical protein
MRVDAQIPEEDFWNHAYTMLIPNNAARKWATLVLKKLGVQRQYVSRRQGYYMTGDPDFIARYQGIINNDQYRALMDTYMPYAPYGIQMTCPGCTGI